MFMLQKRQMSRHLRVDIITTLVITVTWFILTGDPNFRSNFLFAQIQLRLIWLVPDPLFQNRLPVYLAKFTKNSTGILRTRASCEDHLIISGAFCGHSTFWESRQKSLCGRTLMDVLLLEDPKVMSDDCLTLSRYRAMTNVLDLTIKSRNMSLVWSNKPYTWGSERIPMNLKVASSIPKRRTSTKSLSGLSFPQTWFLQIRVLAPSPRLLNKRRTLLCYLDQGLWEMSNI